MGKSATSSILRVAVERLYRLGVRASGLQLNFRTEQPATKDEYLAREILSSRFPTLIVCDISLNSPLDLSITGSRSASSKEMALTFAIDDLEDKLRSKIADFHYCEDNDDAAEENRINNVYQTAVVKTHELPAQFAIRDISQDGIDSKFYLYQVEIGQESLSLFRNHETSVPPQFGILFGEDIENFGNDSEIEIRFPLQYIPNQIGKITLTNRTVVSIPSESQQQHLNDLIKLNTILDDNANYGRSKKSKVSGPAIFNRYKNCVQKAKESMKSSMFLRTYMITPISKRKASSDQSKRIDNDAIGIDWCLIDKILKNELTPYMQWKKDHCQGDEKRAFTKAFAFQPMSANLYVIDESSLTEEFTAKRTFPEDEYRTFEEYYLKRHGIQLKSPELPLIPCREYFSVNREIENTKEEIRHIVPELAVVFPLPWDLIMIHKLLKEFGIVMERNIELRLLLRRLLNLSVEKDRGGQMISISKARSSSLLQLLEEATSTAPCMAYERLEHLGDVVLGFFVAMNYFTLNSSMAWDDEDLGEFKNRTVRNNILIEAGLKVGVDCVIYTKKPLCSWQSCFKGNMNLSAVKNPPPMLYNQIADIVESLLGAIFLTVGLDNDVIGSSDCENIIIGWLEELQLPMKEGDESDMNDKWFKPVHSSLLAGFDFQQHPKWNEQLEKARCVLNSNDSIDRSRMKNGVNSLIKVLECLGPQMNSTTSDTRNTRKILLSCALFDDSMSDAEDDVDMHPSIALARIRESLFFIGDAALHLVLATECYHRYPNASVGDLHLLRCCCIGDEVLAYLAIKYQFDSCLYDQESIYQMQSLVKMSDDNGRNDWARKGGWILGKKEFARRWARTWSVDYRHTAPTTCDMSRLETKSPQYPGIGGGILFGSKAPLGKLYTKNLAYAFKSIIGAIVLSNGVRHMWQIMLPMFEELLILSANEIRENFKNNITNHPGKTARSVQFVRNHRDSYGLGWSAA